MPKVTQQVRGEDLFCLISVKDYCVLSFIRAETGVRLVRSPDCEPQLELCFVGAFPGLP